MKPGDDDFPLGGHGTLRDYFAAAALQGIGLGNSGMGQEHIAALAYSIADAMLKERAK